MVQRPRAQEEVDDNSDKEMLESVQMQLEQARLAEVSI
jgi:hypothetical protein